MVRYVQPARLISCSTQWYWLGLLVEGDHLEGVSVQRRIQTMRRPGDIVLDTTLLWKAS